MEVNGGDVKFKSIYDGETEYRIGSDLYQHMDEDDLRETCGGFYCYGARTQKRTRCQHTSALILVFMDAQRPQRKFFRPLSPATGRTQSEFW
eukprot:SAG31_NODE_102_length_25175_cov_10.778553_8_plen_92_part_00